MRWTLRRRRKPMSPTTEVLRAADMRRRVTAATRDADRQDREIGQFGDVLAEAVRRAMEGR